MNDRLNYTDVIAIICCLFISYTSTSLQFIQTTSMIVLFSVFIIIYPKRYTAFLALTLIFFVHRFLSFTYCHYSGSAWFDQNAVTFQTINNLLQGKSIYMKPALSDTNFALYFPFGSILSAAFTILTGLHFRIFMLFFPLLIYFIYFLQQEKTIQNLLLYIFINYYKVLIKSSEMLGNTELYFALGLLVYFFFSRKQLMKLLFIPLSVFIFFKQSAIFILPYLCIYFLKDRNYKELGKLFSMLTLLALIYILPDLKNFFQFTYVKHVNYFPQSWMKNYSGNLTSNFSISTILNNLGLSIDTIFTFFDDFLSYIKFIITLALLAIASLKIKKNMMFCFFSE